MGTINKRPRPQMSPLSPDSVEDGWEYAVERAAKDADMDATTYEQLVVKLMPRIVDALTTGRLVRVPVLGVLAPWGVERKKTAAGNTKMEHPLYCVIRFRPHPRANAQVINQAPVRRAVNAKYLLVAMHYTDNKGLRCHDAMVQRGELKPRPDLDGVPRTDKEHWQRAKAEGRIIRRRKKKPHLTGSDTG